MASEKARKTVTPSTDEYGGQHQHGSSYDGVPADVISLLVPSEVRDNTLIVSSEKLLYVSDILSRKEHAAALSSLFFRCKRQYGLVEQKIVSHQEFEAKKEELQRKESRQQEQEATTTVSDAISLFRRAVAVNASDIHIRVYTHGGYANVLFRVHGKLEAQEQLSAEYARSLIATIYGTMADVSETTFQPTKQQDARIAKREMLPGGLHGIRIASAPHSFGIFMVLRLLYGDTISVNTQSFEDRLKDLGYSATHINIINRMRQQPAGINIIAGATGSGKSTTLKHIIESIGYERPDLNILTIEDPPEYPIRGSIQMPVADMQEHQGDVEKSSEWALAIKASLRSDPDIIMIGEIRSAESAQQALHAAMTGHQVWTTIHANSAFGCIVRLSTILKPDDPRAAVNDIANSTILSGMMFQRLAQVICPKCAKPLSAIKGTIDPSFLARLADFFRRRISGFRISQLDSLRVQGQGCSHCKSLGIVGRTVVCETVRPDSTMLAIMREDGVEAAENYWLEKCSGRTTWDHIGYKVKKGIVDPFEMERVMGVIDEQ